jgi:sortase B
MIETTGRKRNFLWLILSFLFLLLAIVGAVLLVRQAKRGQVAQEEFADMQESVNEPVLQIADTEEQTESTEDTEEIDVLEAMGITIPEKNLDWDALHEENADIYAWIYVPDTDVDYPVLQHPTDNSYYLNYNIDGTKGFPGCIYTENYNSKDFTDPHTVIYGHNLKSGLMFSTLHNFEDEEVFAGDHYIFIYTEDYVFVYEIFAAYEYSSIHLLSNYDFTNEYVYADFLKSIYEADGRVANIRQDIEVTTEDQIVTLSTCTKDSVKSLRYLVTGVLLNPRQE